MVKWTASAVVLAALLVACGSSGGKRGNGGSTFPPNKQIVLKTSDGKFTVTIPAGALPAGTDPGTLKVTPIPVADAGISFSDGQLLSAYRLEPDGLKLSAPATMELTLDPAAVHDLTAHHLGTGGDETLSLQVAQWTASALSLTTTISHFSVVALEDSPLKNVELLVPPPDAFKGQSFTVRYRITPRLVGDKNLVYGPNPGFYFAGLKAETYTWNVKTWDSIFNTIYVFGSPVTPGSRMAPDQKGLTTSFRDIDFAFKCTGVGAYGIAFDGGVMVKATHTLEVDPKTIPVVCDGVHCNYPVLGATGAPCSTDADCKKQTSASKDGTYRDFSETPQSLANCLKPATDAAGDFIDSVSSNTPAFTAKQVDIVANAVRQATYTQTQVDDLFNNSIYHCGQSDATRTVVCAGGGSTPMPAGPVDVFFEQLAAPVPTADTAKSYIYSVVLDSDGDPTNDWIAQAPYDWDYFQGADRWYQLIWDHAAGKWSLTATQVDASQATAPMTSSTARAVIEGDAITFYVSASELPAPTGYRVTSFGHDGNFTVSSRGGDVSGANPTEPLSAMP